MIRPYPFFGFPPFRRPYPYYSPNYTLHNFENSSSKNTSNTSTPKNSPQAEWENTTKEESFEFFGLTLYFDDLLLIALLFFLYQEEVKDTSLYIALLLLLLS